MCIFVIKFVHKVYEQALARADLCIFNSPQELPGAKLEKKVIFEEVL